MGTAVAKTQWVTRRSAVVRRTSRVVPAHRAPILTATVDEEPMLTRLERAQLRRDAMKMALERAGGLPEHVTVEQYAEQLYRYFVSDGSVAPAPQAPAPQIPAPIPAPETRQSPRLSKGTAALQQLATAVDREVSYWEKSRINPHLVKKFRPLLDAAKA